MTGAIVQGPKVRVRDGPPITAGPPADLRLARLERGAQREALRAASRRAAIDSLLSRIFLQVTSNRNVAAA